MEQAGKEREKINLDEDIIHSLGIEDVQLLCLSKSLSPRFLGLVIEEVRTWNGPWIPITLPTRPVSMGQE